MKNDIQFKYDVEEELLWDLVVDVSCFVVQVKDGVVMFFGGVDRFVDKYVVEEVICCVVGVIVFVIYVDVWMLLEMECLDDEIVQVISSVLYWNVLVLLNVVQIIVENGVVMLCGEVDQDFQCCVVLDMVCRVYGVKFVVNVLILCFVFGLVDLSDCIVKVL